MYFLLQKIHRNIIEILQILLLKKKKKKISETWLVKRTPSKNRSSCLEVFYKKMFLNFLQNSQINTCVGVYFHRMFWATYPTGSLTYLE